MLSFFHGLLSLTCHLLALNRRAGFPVVETGMVTAEVDANRFQPTSLNDKCSVVKRLHMRSTNDDWSITLKSLLAILGENRRSTAQRWIVLARDVHPSVMECLKLRGTGRQNPRS
jgi:hypothetical protein